LVSITQGRNKVCKDGIGGLAKVYLFPYVKYSRSQIILNNNVLVTYPDTTIYEYQVNNNPSVSQNQSEENGSKFYNLNISLELENENPNDFQKILNKDFNIIVKDRNNNFRFLGNVNGLECNSVDFTTGSGKQDFSGVKLGFEGKEEKEAYYINNLQAAGFTISGTEPVLILSSTDTLSSTNLLASI
tara:strand:- start:165 stop:725 length:561 start_codon:yes stop_codon:yes gene_type:complete